VENFLPRNFLEHLFGVRQEEVMLNAAAFSSCGRLLYCDAYGGEGWMHGNGFSYFLMSSSPYRPVFPLK
jgi:hypothetical protein